MESSFAIQSIVHNGNIMTKKELLIYFSEVMHILSDMEKAEQRIFNRRPQISALKLELKRRTFPMPYKAPPSGLAALSPKKKREYQNWLANAPQRDAEQRVKEAEEDLRIKAVEEKLSVLEKQQEADAILAVSKETEYVNKLDEGILPDEYAKQKSMKAIIQYLITDRAHTLTDAINLYCQEQHWERLEKIALEQKKELIESQQRMEMQQKHHMAQMRAMQRQQAEELQESMDATRRAAEDAKFYAEMNFLFTVFEKD